MDKLMFSSILRQRLASITIEIVSINDLRKEFRPACNLNTSSLKVHIQEIVSVLQGIVSSTKSLHQDLLSMAQNNHLFIQ